MKAQLGYVRLISRADIDTAASEDGNEDEEESDEDENECAENGIDESDAIKSDDDGENSEVVDDDEVLDLVEQLEQHCENDTASDEINATNDSATDPLPTNRDRSRPDLLRIEPRPHRLSVSSANDSYDEPFDARLLLDRQLQLVAFHDIIYHRRILMIPSTEPQHFPFAEPMQGREVLVRTLLPRLLLKVCVHCFSVIVIFFRE